MKYRRVTERVIRLIKLARKYMWRLSVLFQAFSKGNGHS